MLVRSGVKNITAKKKRVMLDEEVREVGYEITSLNYRNFDFMKCAYQNEKLPDNWIEETEKSVKNAIKELAQVGAVVRKIRTTKEGGKDAN